MEVPQPIKITQQQPLYESKSPDGTPTISKPKMPNVKEYTDYIRQHALKYVSPAPHPSNESYHTWHEKLKKVENILHKKYMNKLARTIHQYENVTVTKKQSAIGDKPSELPLPNIPNIPHTPPKMHTPTTYPPTTSSNPEELQQIIYNLYGILYKNNL